MGRIGSSRNGEFLSGSLSGLPHTRTPGLQPLTLYQKSCRRPKRRSPPLGCSRGRASSFGRSPAARLTA